MQNDKIFKHYVLYSLGTMVVGGALDTEVGGGALATTVEGGAQDTTVGGGAEAVVDGAAEVDLVGHQEDHEQLQVTCLTSLNIKVSKLKNVLLSFTKCIMRV